MLRSEGNTVGKHKTKGADRGRYYMLEQKPSDIEFQQRHNLPFEVVLSRPPAAVIADYLVARQGWHTETPTAVPQQPLQTWRPDRALVRC